MNAYKNKIIIFAPFFIFLIFTYVISRKLIGGIISIGDFSFFWPFSSLSSFSTWDTAYLGFSRASTMFGLQFFSFVSIFFEYIGFSNESISYIQNYAPVYICSLVYYFIAKKLSNNIFIAYLAGFFVILNNFVLEHFLVFPGVIFYSLIVYGFTIYLSHTLYYEGLNFSRMILIVLLSFFHFHPFYFAINFLYILIFVLFYCYNRLRFRLTWQLSIKFILLFLGLIMIQGYWLVPFMKNIFVSSSLQVYGGDSQFAVFSGYLQSITHINLLSLYHYPGTLGIKMSGDIIQFLFYIYLLSILIILYLKNKAYKNAWITFLFFNLIIFFILALGPKSYLLGDTWLYLYENVPALGFFRSFSRFIIFYLVIFIFIFIFLLKNLRNKYKNYFIFVNILVLFIINLIFLSGNLNGFIAGANVPKEYDLLNNKYFIENDLQYNVLALPNIPYESYSWTKVDKRTEGGENITQSVYFREKFFSKPIAYNRYAVNLDERSHLFELIFKYDKEFSFSENFSKIIDILNARFIIIQKDIVNLYDENKKIDVRKYDEYFKNNIDFELKEDNQYFTLYENQSYFPIIMMQEIQFKKINDTKYVLSIKNLKEKKQLIFLQGYNEQWSIYPKSIDDISCESIKYFEESYVTECRPESRKFELDDLIYLSKESKFNDTHKVVSRYANGWKIDPEYIRNNFDKSEYKENPDGSIDINLVLYFKPQSYFYLGLLISGTTLLVCLGYLGYDWRKRRKVAKVIKEKE